MSAILRRWEIAAIWYIVPTVVILFDYFNTSSYTAPIVSELSVWGRVLIPLMLLLGGVSLIRYQARGFVRRLPSWQLISLIFISAALYLGVAYIYPSAYLWVQNNIYMAFTIAVMSIDGPYIMGSLLHGASMRNRYAEFMMVVCVLGLLTNVLLGTMIWSGFDIIRDWVQGVLGAAGVRGIIIGVTIGGLATVVKRLLGLEKAYLGEIEEEKK